MNVLRAKNQKYIHVALHEKWKGHVLCPFWRAETDVYMYLFWNFVIKIKVTAPKLNTVVNFS